MGEYEPTDSRIVTQNPSNTPIEPDRTGHREGESRGEKPDEKISPKPVTKSTTDEKDRWQVNEEAAKKPDA